jgi:hypothetical protein
MAAATTAKLSFFEPYKKFKEFKAKIYYHGAINHNPFSILSFYSIAHL